MYTNNIIKIYIYIYMSDNSESLSSTKTEVYPFCYKIKETCLPCNDKNNNLISVNNPIDCIAELSKLDKSTGSYFNETLKEKYLNNLFDCLKKYGDIYKKLGIELYVNPKTKQITFPDNSRIQSNFNLFVKETNFETYSPREFDDINYKLMLYNILLNDNLRKKYNDFYYSSDFGELESLMPKEYGITRIMGKEIKKEGGKRRKTKRTKTRKTKRTKTRKTKRTKT